MTKVTMAGTVLALALTTVTAQSAHAVSFYCTVKGIAERPAGTGPHGPAVTCTDGKAVTVPLAKTSSNPTLVARFLSVAMGALLSGRQIWFDVGTCTHATDCDPVAWELK